ncbi:hypothetical protein GCM10025787_56070 [Saccharopolyspora rosea]
MVTPVGAPGRVRSSGRRTPTGTPLGVAGRLRPVAVRPAGRVVRRGLSAGARSAVFACRRSAGWDEWVLLTSVAIFSCAIVILVGLFAGCGAPAPPAAAVPGDALRKAAAQAEPGPGEVAGRTGDPGGFPVVPSGRP